MKLILSPNETLSEQHSATEFLGRIIKDGTRTALCRLDGVYFFTFNPMNGCEKRIEGIRTATAEEVEHFLDELEAA
jgi:hypothetical protein